MIGGFGKIPSKGDFVRVGHSDVTSRAFESWLDDACTRVREAGLALPDASVRFVLRPAGSAEVCGGVLRPSSDAVGRQFPLSLFHMIAWSSAQPRWSGLPVLIDRFIESADEVLRESALVGLDALRAGAAALWTPGADDLAATDQVCQRVLAVTPWRELAERLFPPPVVDRAAYAFRTALLACQRRDLAIACPIETDVDLFFWLELFRRCARDDAFGFVWVEEPAPRLIVSLGQPTTSMLLAIADPARESDQIWPLTTTRAAALEAAAVSMAPVLEPIRDGAAPLGALLETLSRARIS